MLFTSHLILLGLLSILTLGWVLLYVINPSKRKRQWLVLSLVLSLPLAGLFLVWFSASSLAPIAFVQWEWLELGLTVSLCWSLLATAVRSLWHPQYVQPVQIQWRNYGFSIVLLILGAYIGSFLPWPMEVTLAGLLLVLALGLSRLRSHLYINATSLGVCGFFLIIVGLLLSTFVPELPRGMTLLGWTFGFSWPTLLLGLTAGAAAPSLTQWWLGQSDRRYI